MLSLDAAHWVLKQYPNANTVREIVTLRNSGGFSGANLWRVETATGSFCLRTWPPGGINASQLEAIHRWMAQARSKDCAFVPAVCHAADRQTWVKCQRRLWDLTKWLPGQADFHVNPDSERLRASCIALAKIHRAWAAHAGPSRPAPAVARRLERLRQWQSLVQAGWRPSWSAQPQALSMPSQRAWHVLHYHLPALGAILLPWAERSFAVQPCLCDIWHDHVLFTGNTVTGIVDYGSTKIDNTAVDLARLLGSLVGDDTESWRIGLAAYRSVESFSAAKEDLAHVLDLSGTWLALANWLIWLYHARRQFENAELVVKRLETILVRVEEPGLTIIN